VELVVLLLPEAVLWRRPVAHERRQWCCCLNRTAVLLFFFKFFPPFLAFPSYISAPLLFDSFPPLFGLFSFLFSFSFISSVLSLSGLFPPSLHCFLFPPAFLQCSSLYL